MTALGLVVLVSSLRIVISDLHARRVPNAWLIAGFLAGTVLVAVLAFSSSASSAVPHVIGLLAGFFALIPFHVIRWMGAGDVKFFAVLGFLLGWQALLPLWIGASLLAGIHAVAVYAWRGLRAFFPLRLAGLLHQLAELPAVRRMESAREGRVGIPYAAYLGMAAIAWVFAFPHGGST